MERQIPKNVRQIGNVSDNPKIYVEDYVVRRLETGRSVLFSWGTCSRAIREILSTYTERSRCMS